MVKKNNVNARLMLDVISSVVKNKYIPSDQTCMVEQNTRGRKGSMKCRINTHQEEVLLCRFDQGSSNFQLFPYFQQSDGMVSMCDYILFVENDKELVAFSIDLKDSSISSKKQTLNTRTFAEFIINRIKIVKGDNAFPKPVRYQQIGIKTTCGKMTTKGYAQLAYDPDGYLVWPDYHCVNTRLLMDA